MIATTTLILYKSAKTEIVAEVFAGEKYYLPTAGDVVDVYEGTLSDFLNENPEYQYNDFEI